MICQRFSFRLACAGLVSLGWMLHSTSTARAEAVATFQGLGDLPGGSYFSVANAVSASGVVGYSNGSSGPKAFLALPPNPTLIDFGPGGTFANDISPGGSVVVGRSVLSPPQALRWEGGVITSLGDLPGGSFNSEALAVAGDNPNAVVVGYGTSNAGQEAFRWTNASGMVGLGDLSGGGFSSVANAVSSDGSIVVGRGTSASGQEAFRWTSSTGMVGLGDLSGGTFSSVANDVSSNGSVVVGGGVSAFGAEAFRWFSGFGMFGLGDLPGGTFSSVANAVSSDGLLVVGNSQSGFGQEAFLYTNGEMRSLASVLSDYGVSPTDFRYQFSRLSEANDVFVSGNFAVVVGTGLSTSGTQAFHAQIPIVSASLADELLSLTPGLTSDTLSLDVSATQLLYDGVRKYEFDFTTDGIYDLTLDINTPLFNSYWNALTESFDFPEADFRTFLPGINAGDFGSLTFNTRIRMTHYNGTAINTSDAVITVVPELGSLGLLGTASLIGTGIMTLRRRSAR